MPDIDLSDLLDEVEPGLRKKYAEVIARLRKRNQLADVEHKVSQGRYEEAIDGLEEAAEELSAEFVAIFMLAARAATRVIRIVAPHGFAFDMTNIRVVDLLRNQERYLVELFKATMRTAVTTSLRSGTSTLVGRDLITSLGLGRDQIEALAAHRRALVMSDRENARRKLRELSPRSPLSGRDQARIIQQDITRFRVAQAERTALWLGQIAVNQAVEQAVRQAIEYGALREGDIERIWETRLDPLVRDSHGPMHGQRRPMGRAFITGAGNQLLYPCDPQGTPRETRNCRCGLRYVLSQG